MAGITFFLKRRLKFPNQVAVRLLKAAKKSRYQGRQSAEKLKEETKSSIEKGKMRYK